MGAKSLLSIAITGALLLTGCGKGTTESKSLSFFAMDTYMTVTAYGEDSEELDAALERARSRAQELEGLWSVTREDSDIWRLDRSGGEPVQVSAETAELISFGMDMYKKTDGSLDIAMYPLVREWGFTTGEYRIPEQERIDELLRYTGADRISLEGRTVTLPEGMEIDLGSLGKGQAGDELIRELREAGVTSALLDLGGNIQALGAKPDGSPWKIAIRDPMGEGSLARLEVIDRAVITSGGYERYFVGEDGVTYWHILDPATGSPARSGILSATVIGQEGRLCDALSTSLFVMGEARGAELWRELGGFDMVLVTGDGRVVITEGIKDSFALYPEFQGMTVEVLER